MPDTHSAKLPTLVLIVLTPLVAELSWGSLPIQAAYALPFLVPIYGCGALLVRELVARAGRGWASILLLGVAYGIVEDGFGLKAMFSPHTYHAAEWGARVLGVNWAYTELNVVYHAAFTIALPILVTNLIFPTRRYRPYLRKRGVAITAACYLLGVALLRLAVAPNAPGAVPTDSAPVGYLVVAGAVVVALGVLALGVLPRATRRPTSPGTPPAPHVVAAVTGVGTILALRLPAPLGAASSDPHPLFGPEVPVLVQIMASLASVAVALDILRRWAARAGWSDRHLVGLAGGALLAHTIVGASLFAVTNTAESVTLAVLGTAEAALTLLLYRRVHAREAGRQQLPASRAWTRVKLQFRADPRGDQFYALTTFRRDGSAVSTPIWLAPAGGHWYGYTPGHSGKVRRITRNGNIEVAESDFHGQPRGSSRSGRARILPPSQLSTAKRALRAKYGMKFRLFVAATLLGRHRKRAGHAVGLEITVDGHPSPAHTETSRSLVANHPPDARSGSSTKTETVAPGERSTTTDHAIPGSPSRCQFRDRSRP